MRASFFFNCASAVSVLAVCGVGACTRDTQPERAPSEAEPTTVATAPGSAAHRELGNKSANQSRGRAANSAAGLRPAPSANAAPNAAPNTAPNDGAVPEPVAARLLAIAAEYRTYGRVDDEMRWAPFLCRIPMPASAHLSKSKHASTHGRKLYSLFAKDRPAYLTIDKKPSPTGQVIVKESWVPEEMDPEKVPMRRYTEPVPGAPDDGESGDPGDPGSLIGTGDHFHPFARAEGKAYRAKERGPLFIMYKLADDHPGSDQGWVYGTVSTDGKEVTAGGRIRSCMKCHEKAPHGRLFGLQGG